MAKKWVLKFVSISVVSRSKIFRVSNVEIVVFSLSRRSICEGGKSIAVATSMVPLDGERVYKTRFGKAVNLRANPLCSARVWHQFLRVVTVQANGIKRIF